MLDAAIHEPDAEPAEGRAVVASPADLRDPAPATSSLVLYGGIYARRYEVPNAHTMMEQHRHTFPHLSAIVSGAVRVKADGVDLGEHRAPALVKIAARTTHTFVTLAPNTVILCLHAVGEAEDVAIEGERQLVEEG